MNGTMMMDTDQLRSFVHKIDSSKDVFLTGLDTYLNALAEANSYLSGALVGPLENAEVEITNTRERVDVVLSEYSTVLSNHIDKTIDVDSAGGSSISAAAGQ